MRRKEGRKRIEYLPSQYSILFQPDLCLEEGMRGRMEEKKQEELKEEKVDKSVQDSELEKEDKAKEQATTAEFISIVKEYNEVNKELIYVLQKIYEKECKQSVSEKVKEMADNVKQKAKNLGQKIEKVEEIYKLNKDTKDNILQQYKDSLSEIDNYYEKVYQAVLRQKVKNQDQEQATILKEYELKQNRKKIKKSPQYAEQIKQEKALAKEIKKALDKGDLDTVAVKNEELKCLKSKNPLMLCDKEIERTQTQRFYIQQLITECDQELENVKIERKSRIQQATQDKDNQLATVKKQGLFKKVVGAIRNKISGAKMFKDNVIEKLAEKMGYIKQEMIPQVERDTTDKVINMDAYNEKKRREIVGENPETREELMEEAENRLKANQERETEQPTIEVEENNLEVG